MWIVDFIKSMTLYSPLEKIVWSRTTPTLTDEVITPVVKPIDESASIGKKVWDDILKAQEDIMQNIGMSPNMAYYAAQVDTYRHQMEMEKARIDHMADVLRYSLEPTAFKDMFKDNKEKTMADTQICTISKVKNGFVAKMANGDTLVGDTLIVLCESVKAHVMETTMMEKASPKANDTSVQSLWRKAFTP